MKDKAEDLRDELSQVILRHAEASPNTPTEFPQELLDRVVAYVLQQRKHGITIAKCSERLNISQARLHYWMYGRGKTGGGQQKPRLAALRPVQVSSEIVRVPDGAPEPRFTVRSPAGWEVKDLRLAELAQLLRSLH